MSSIYIHIPFCDTLCSYCDFCKVLNYQKFTNKYLDKLDQEITKEYNNQEIKTLYIGGGTPSALSLSETKLLAKTLEKLSIKDEYEFTFECNFENTTKEKLDLLKEIGVNRLSFGIQTFNRRLLKIINRSHTYENVVDTINYARSIGFNNINVDLIFNLPTQTFEELEIDLKLFLSLNVEHISLYSLILEEKSVFGSKGIEVDEDLGTTMYLHIMKELSNNGFNHYEISNFCKKGYESKHNLVYWNYNEFYGFGLGAHGLVNNKRYENTTSITKYLSDCEREEIELTTEDIRSEYIFMNLRKLEGLNLLEFKDRFNVDLLDLYNIDKIVDDLVVIENDFLKLTSKGILFANDVFIEFIGD